MASNCPPNPSQGTGPVRILFAALTAKLRTLAVLLFVLGGYAPCRADAPGRRSKATFTAASSPRISSCSMASSAADPTMPSPSVRMRLFVRPFGFSQVPTGAGWSSR